MSDRKAHFLVPVAGLFLVVLIFIGVHFFSGGTGYMSPLDRGVLWIRHQQEEYGAWRGKEISVLQSGPAMTAFVLYAMSRLPPPMIERYRDSLIKGAASVMSHMGAGGYNNKDDFPTYATSLTILAFSVIKPNEYEQHVAWMADTLKKGQLDESEGWSPEDPEYGGWAFGGPPQPKPAAHRLDISTTRFALEALEAAGISKSDPVWARARRFLERCQNSDGGFRFTTLEGQDKADGKSYGSATADGLRALRAAEGAPERRAAAEKWLKDHFTAEVCPGFPPDHPRDWAHGLRGYWLATAARVVGPEARAAIRKAVESSQRADGSWVNDNGMMLENEPLLATALAVLALAETEPVASTQ